MKIGFIGTGVMGTGIINNLLRAGNEVTVYNRTKAHATSVLNNGASWADSPAQLTQDNDVIMSMVGFPRDVREVYLADNGVMSAVHPGQLLIDMTTSQPSLAAELAKLATKKGATMLDAPVSGGDVGAKKGTLTIMVGGNKQTFDQYRQFFTQFGSDVHYFGTAGSGQHAKMANQIMIAGTMTGLVEMLVYAKKARLKLDDILATVGGGAAANWSLSNYGPRILKGDYTPGFFAKHFLKDLRIALQESEKMDLDLPATKTAKHLYELLVDNRGLGNDGTQALVKLWWQD
ncbi:MAG: NAD(P)-dependent oxidoreductase [[Lactobacillus] timonensis]|jgi:3-hydroxyisobutyrate dehydrogenase|uniref:NAD(P)-dependent oxidoreductase n=1 Tax=[Lactobacillus] timonensis TaxID=1970790 RepID=UPI002353B99C|nr:NAD(P)-dependent oxidoreductase [[Lactobacillus] timonensis]MCI1925511.1 NAD(P)-dependent oxidoreductase [[Lactobacillus] timonensis]MCI1956869.1 NAD(P)-dependent oxidoreductase [[Lactobacillus] timonensis]MCI1969859.1 NAD(P)-dependent oxidoreductase [[Lactobacillus] timonensis]MCI2006060.1 NAD(P)-dependent oxidoreductase [[Lactobacillus] timonensis]